jgi:hypothetical protein
MNTRLTTTARLFALGAATLTLATLAAPAMGQQATPGAPAARSSGIPQRDTLIKMQRPVTITFTDQRLEDVMRFLTEVTGADMEVMWLDERNMVGLDKDRTINVRIDRRTALQALEAVLERAGADSMGSGESTWQLSEHGTLQVGPKERLNRYKRVEVYSIRDLLLELPVFDNVPEFDLQAVLQGGGQGGGGGGQSPFREAQNDARPTRTVEERAQDLMDLIRDLVERDQWIENGGDGASMRFFQSNLLVNAPDYVHRQLNGYPYWPTAATRYNTVKGRRYVTLGLEASNSTIDGIENQPVTPPGGSIAPSSGGGRGVERFGPDGSRSNAPRQGN